MTSASSMHEAGHSNPALWDNLRDEVGREEKVRLRVGGHMCIHG